MSPTPFVSKLLLLLRKLATVTHTTSDSNKELCYRKEAARCFVSLNILLSHSRSFKMPLLSGAYSIETMSVSRTVSEIFNVKECRDLYRG